MIRAVVVGAGHRGRVYASYAAQFPDKMQIVGVVEPQADSRDDFACLYDLSLRFVFASFDDFCAAPDDFANAVIISSPDAEHFKQTIGALERGYHVLLEKPIARSYHECVAIAQKARECARVVSVCFPLRHHPLCVRVLELIEAGTVGRVVMINHTEYVGVERMTHNFVRGGWNTEERAGPILLSKSCHDLDYIVALAGAPCRAASTYGSLLWFRLENAPEGSAERCLDCAVEADCPYSAVRIYLRKASWLRHFRSNDPQHIRDILRGEDFGRCVYRAGNDLWDNQVLAMQMSNGVSVSFSLNAFTDKSLRRTHIMGSEGEILVDDTFSRIEHRRFVDESCVVEDFSHVPTDLHCGADWVLVERFIEAVESGAYLPTSIDTALESHRIALDLCRVD